MLKLTDGFLSFTCSMWFVINSWLCVVPRGAAGWRRRGGWHRGRRGGPAGLVGRVRQHLSPARAGALHLQPI